MKTEKCRISIIVPIYRVEPYICNCIESICRQTYEDLEILLVDDGSPDKCGEICDKYALKDKRIKVFHIENSGQSHARNIGLNEATGEYVGFVDGDDKILPDMYEKLLQEAVKHKANIVECNFYGRKHALPDSIPDGVIITMTGREAIRRQLDSRTASRFPSTSVWSKLFKKEAIRDLRFPDGKIHEEFAFLCEAFLNAENYVYVNKCLYERTLREDSTTAENFSKRTLDKIYVYQLRNEVLKKRKEDELLQLSKEREYELLLHYIAMAKKTGLIEEEHFIAETIAGKKQEIIKSKLPFKKKLQYCIFFVNKNLYYRLKKDNKYES